MFSTLSPWKRFLLIAGIALVGVGLGAVIYFSAGIFSSYGEFRFVHMHHFDSHEPDTSFVRSWMSVQFVSTAYHIPEEYLFRRLNIPMTQRNGLLSFRMLSSQYTFGSGDSLSSLLDKIRASIDFYRRRFPPPYLMHGSGGFPPARQGAFDATHPQHG